jgi:3-methyl-2-oxobutanoate hydroxymethyltransferase
MSTTKQAPGGKITAAELRRRKSEGETGKIVVVTAYDYTFARLVDEWVDVILVGDSLGMVVQGEPNTLSVQMDHMVYHSRAVAGGIRHAHLVVDMPFLSYQASPRDAIRNAGRLLAEGRAEAVKLEGGVTIAPTVEKLVDLGIPVLGHIGLTPQSVHLFGGFKIQGRTEKARQLILEDALALEDAGAYGLVLEGIPAELAATISQRVKIPTIGIGAGAGCDGQVLVLTDMLGLNTDFQPRFVKRFAELGEAVQTAVRRYGDEVRRGEFPGSEHSF